MIYVANPYTSHDESVMQRRYKQAEAYTAHMNKHGFNAISPIVHGHHLALNHDMPTDYDFWEQWCIELLLLCDEIHVLQSEGWQESRGVKSELSHAYENGLTVTYISNGILENI